jgi:tRNA pseudouridine38-40 synthase
MATVKLTLEYDGGGFAGWAAQPGMRTVEGELSAALATILGAPVTLSVAGRTDAGVHARGQVASCTLGAEARILASDAEQAELASSLNGALPSDLAVIAAESVGDGFDARRDARSRTYCYRVLARRAPSPLERGRVLWWPRTLDEASLHKCAGRLVGRRDFTAFTPTQSDHVRFERDVLGAQWERRGALLELWIEADAFVRQMVRVLVGTMLEVAAGRRTVDDFVRLLEGAPRSEAGPTAEPYGLYLASVRY